MDTPNQGGNQGQQPPRQPKKPAWQRYLMYLAYVVFILAALGLLYSSIAGDRNKDNTLTISEVAQQVIAGEVAGIEVSGDKLEVTLAIEEGEEEIVKKSKKPREISLEEALVSYGVTAEQLQAANIENKSESGFGFWLLNILPILLPILFIILIFWFLMRGAKGAGMQMFSFGQSKARITDPSKQRITFKDVAGVHEAKHELEEVVDFLRNPKKFLDIGAEIPKGVLLMGAPGTGKTLLARAVAGEAKVPFFHLSGSEFVEMFVGVGASRVRDLFKVAKEASPAIIFIDEIDAVGRSRGIGVGGGNDEREQTLNQILVEMDGFEPNEKLIIMAATNRPDVLDPALLRPGRFDRRVTLDEPDRRDREDVLKIHARKKPLAEDVDLQLIATRTPGFSGADLQSLMNEAAILAARENRKQVSQFDLIRSIEKVMIGPERKSHLFNAHERRVTAYHEAGHAIVGSALEHADPVHKVSIVSRGRAGGYTLRLPLEEKKLQTKNEFLDDIAMSLGGYVAEKMTFGDITTGPENDLQVATKLARNMVVKWGMSDKIGPIALKSGSGQTLFGEGVQNNEYSEKVGDLIDNEISKIMNEAMARAETTLKKHKKALEAVAEKLLEVETLEQQEYNDILVLNGIEPKRKQEE